MSVDSVARRDLAARMADAASALTATLDARQREAAVWPFPADDERRLWFYTPTDHGGVTLADLAPPQQRLALQLVACGLSRAGYVTVATIMGLENVLDEAEGWTGMFPGRTRGRDPSRYYLRVFGDPPSGTWSWRFGGHHVSIHHTVIDGEARSCTPSFMGADPASSPLLGPHPLRPLAGAEDLGRELVRALDDGQQALAILAQVAPTDIVGGNRPGLSDGDLPIPLKGIWRGVQDDAFTARLEATQRRAEEAIGLRPEDLEAVRLTLGESPAKGVAVSALDGGQQELLRALLAVYVDRVPEALADAEAEKYAGDRLLALHFAWAGGLEPGQPHYYRVQGPRLLVEYDNTQRGVNHAHAVWRDPDGDFGGDVLAEHHAAHHRT
jgi:Protein of unknown function (DUF3500)